MEFRAKELSFVKFVFFTEFIIMRMRFASGLQIAKQPESSNSEK